MKNTVHNLAGIAKGENPPIIGAFNSKAAKSVAGKGTTIHQLVSTPPEDTEMRLFMLVQEQHLPIPDDIETVVNYGLETIRTENDGRVRGNSMYLRGNESAFVVWLKSFDGVWITNNPMVGQWKVAHIKDSLNNTKEQ